ncbi:MAG: right-handed parallel beta-helix repeat-containing protein, partial [Planctomycetes bacterium]|nr:right-handed parallel beta-helix repeat-containing protein [Planctomycetota bacterium]
MRPVEASGLLRLGIRVALACAALPSTPAHAAGQETSFSSSLSSSPSSPSSSPFSLFIAPDGNDADPGTRERPLRSLEAARDAIRRDAARIRGPVTVWIRGGRYERTRTFRLGKEDSGSPAAPRTYRAFDDEEVILTGGREVEASWFHPIDDARIRARIEPDWRGKALQVSLREHGITDYGELGGLTGGLAVFAGGKRLPIARWPDQGFALMRRLRPQEQAGGARIPETAKRTVFVSYAGPGPRPWNRPDDAWLRGYFFEDYFFQAWRIAAIDPDRREILLPHEAGPRLDEWRRFYAVHVLEEMDQPGEWLLDRETGILYLVPFEGFGRDPIVVSILQDALIALDEASHVTIRGIALEATRGAAVTIGGGTGNRIAGCTIRHVGQAAVLAGGTDNGIAGCDIEDVAGQGIRLAGGDRATLTPARLFAENNHIHHYALELKSWTPAIKIEGVGNRAAHNHIHDAPQYAIAYDGNDHVMELNDIHDVDLEMSDVGVIGCGTDWTIRGNIVRHNYIHDIPERPYPGTAGVYLDNCASSTAIIGNVFRRVHQAAFLGGGRDNRIENNIFIECDCPVHLDNRGLRWDHFRPDGPMYQALRKVPYDRPPWSTRYPALARILDEIPQAPLGNTLLRNVSYRSSWRDPEAECRRTFHTHIDRPYMTIADNYVTDEDPGFVGAAAGNYALRDDSIVYEKVPGFRRIPWERIGLYLDEFRRRRPGPRLDATPFSDALAVWHLGDLSDAGGAPSDLLAEGAVDVGVALEGGDRDASRTRGGDGRGARLGGGWLVAGHGANGELDAPKEALSLLVRLRDPSGAWGASILSKYGDHRKLSYNLFTADLGEGMVLGFELGTDRTDPIAQVLAPMRRIGLLGWHDCIARYDGRSLDFWVDGIRVAWTPAAGRVRANPGEPCIIGGHTSGGQVMRPFRGLIDCAAIWDRALSGAEIEALSGGADEIARRIRERREEELREAAASRRRLAADPYRPVYHFLAPEGWMNDPNGPILYRGAYHLFYQYAPPPRGRICWGHAVSEDLVHWRDLPIAMYPDTPHDRGGVYSGNTVIDGAGELCALYTGNVRGHEETYGILARSADGGLTWRKRVVMDAPPYPGTPVHWDGQIWRRGGEWYQLVGGTYEGGGAALLWSSPDLVRWTFRSRIFSSKRYGPFWELPYLLPFGEKHVLIAGVWPVRYWIGH